MKGIQVFQSKGNPSILKGFQVDYDTGRAEPVLWPQGQSLGDSQGALDVVALECQGVEFVETIRGAFQDQFLVSLEVETNKGRKIRAGTPAQ